MNYLQAKHGDPNVRVAVGWWHMMTAFLPAGGFVKPEEIDPLDVLHLGGKLGYASDLQGALDAARRFILADLQSSPVEERARTQYDVVLIGSGGAITCSANDALPSYASAQNPNGTWQDAYDDMCNSGPLGSVCDPVYGFNGYACLHESGFQLGGDRNQNAQLLNAVDALAQLGTFAQQGVRVHTRLAYSLSTMQLCGVICQDLDPLFRNAQDARSVAAWRFQAMAAEGHGSFQDPGEPSGLSVENVECSPP
jgi:hypothetical protein